MTLLVMDLSQELRERLQGAGIVTAYLFGSQARGDARPDSDADIAALLGEDAPSMTLLEEAALASAMAQELDVEDVDLIVLDRAPLELRARVVRGGRVLFSDDEPRRVRFEVDTQSRWFDVEPTHALQTKAYLRRVAATGLGQH